MDSFFSGNWTGQPFILFGPGHLAGLVIILLINLSFFKLWKDASENTRRSFRYGLAALLILDEAAWHAWNFSTGNWTLRTMLPLHLCSILVFLSAYMLVKRSYAIYEFAYLLGIAGALQALLTPDAGIYGFPHFRAFQVMISHGAIITAAVYMTVVEGFRPTPASLKRVFIGSNLYLLFVGLVNWAIGSNYLFIAHKPETASLLDVLPAWPWYILYIEGLGVAFMLLLYLPFWLKDLNIRRQAAAF
jgi:hypothetical integral membrane protein (TIGR02206 family)